MIHHILQFKQLLDMYKAMYQFVLLKGKVFKSDIKKIQE